MLFKQLPRIFACVFSFFTCGVAYAPPLDIADFFPLDIGSEWNYEGLFSVTTPESPISISLGLNVNRLNLPGGVINGRETTLAFDLATSTVSVGGEILDLFRGIYYSQDEFEFAVHREDHGGTDESDISLFEAPLFITP